MIQEASAARDVFLQTKSQFLGAFDRIAADRRDWSPSPTARTPIEIVAHCAESIHNITQMILGNRFAIENTRDADAHFRTNENRVSGAKEALQMFENSSSEFLDALESLTESDLLRPFVPPFGMSEVPLPVSLNFPADHTRWHIGQLEYIQTIYGDRNWGF